MMKLYLTEYSEGLADAFILELLIHIIFNNMQQPQSKLINIAHLLETVLKFAFIGMSLLNAPFTIIVGLFASLIGLFRIVKAPKLSK